MVNQNRETEEVFAEITQHNKTNFNGSIYALEISTKLLIFQGLIVQFATPPQYLKEV